MTPPAERKVVLVTRATRLEDLVARYHSVAQARFYIEHLGADFADYLAEHETYQAARQSVITALAEHGRYQLLDRRYLANFVFAADDVILALGQDGLVANILKYLDGQPLVGINPDPARWDGVLLPFQHQDVRRILPEVLHDKRAHRNVTMARAQLSDGQSLLAVNDLFIGPKSHTSARYEIALGAQREVQSSSGLIISTGLGSTAWMKSVVTGSVAIAAAMGAAGRTAPYVSMPSDADYLVFAVREPFPSISSRAALVYGRIDAAQPLGLRSLMPENGVIFSDGIETDRIDFNSGMEAVVGIASRQGRLVI